MEHLANTLRALASSKDVNLLAVANALEKHTNEVILVVTGGFSL